MGLIPIDGGGGEAERPTCFRCNEPAFGPCAMCRVMICGADECSSLVEEPGLEQVVLCRDCAKYRPWLSSSPFTAPILAAIGSLGLLAVGLSWGSMSWAVGVGAFVSCCLLLLAGATAIARRQWRARLRRARESRESRAARSEM